MRYRVSVKLWAVTEIEADSPEDALAKVEEMSCGDFKPHLDGDLVPGFIDNAETGEEHYCYDGFEGWEEAR